MIKTIWHWKAIFKTLGLVLLAGAIVGFLPIPAALSFPVGMFAGAAAVIYGDSKWEMYHFE